MNQTVDASVTRAAAPLESPQIEAVLAAALTELAELRWIDGPAAFMAQTELYGPAGLLDSLGLVHLVAAVEESLRRDFGVSVTVVSERAFSARRSPFRTIGTLTEFILERTREQDHAG
ncbi:MAG: hypothetical protein U1A27_12350 [Phycisphaerae bacterium]